VHGKHIASYPHFHTYISYFTEFYNVFQFRLFDFRDSLLFPFLWTYFFRFYTIFIWLSLFFSAYCYYLLENTFKKRSSTYLFFFLCSVWWRMILGRTGQSTSCGRTVTALHMDQITTKTTNPKCRLFLKNWPVKGPGGKCSSVWGPWGESAICPNTQPDPLPPLLHAVYKLY
jgi:hypothetical protein